MKARKEGERTIDNPEQALWCEVLRLAIEDASCTTSVATPGGETAERRAREHAQAVAWLSKPSRDLEFVCDLAGVDMEILIERMVKRIAAAPAPEELFARRRSRSKTYELDGEHLSLAEWSDRHGMSVDVVRARMRKGAGLREALESRLDFKSGHGCSSILG